jgi:hypothetical protein
MNIKHISTQLVIFSPGIVIPNKLKVANAINEKLSNLLDSDPLMIPLPEDAPPELPRIRMSSKDGRYSLSIAGNRIDFIFQYREEDERFFPIVGFYDKFLTIFEYFSENIHTQFTRSAIVTQWVIELEKTSAVDFLLDKYIESKTPIINPHALELHYLLKSNVAKFDVNQWVRIKTSRDINQPQSSNQIFVLVDINTLAEIAYEIDKDSLQKFLEEGSRLTKETIEEHFKKRGDRNAPPVFKFRI